MVSTRSMTKKMATSLPCCADLQTCSRKAHWAVGKWRAYTSSGRCCVHKCPCDFCGLGVNMRNRPYAEYKGDEHIAEHLLLWKKSGVGKYCSSFAIACINVHDLLWQPPVPWKQYEWRIGVELDIWAWKRCSDKGRQNVKTMSFDSLMHWLMMPLFLNQLYDPKVYILWLTFQQGAERINKRATAQCQVVTTAS